MLKLCSSLRAVKLCKSVKKPCKNMDFLQNYFRGPTKGSANPKKLNGKVALITGATSGIGQEVAKDLAARGAKVLILARDLAKAQKVKEDILQNRSSLQNLGTVRIYQANLSSLKSVQNCAAEILQNENKIDYLINNAGIMMCPYELSTVGYFHPSSFVFSQTGVR